MAAPDDSKNSSFRPGADTTRADRTLEAQAHEPGRGREAARPQDIPTRGWWDVTRRTYEQLGEDNLSIVAAGMAFYAFTAMVPALAAVVAIYALVNDPAAVTAHIESVAHVLPEQTRPLLHEQLTRLTSDDHSAGWGAAIGIGIALFGAMKAITALMTGLNIAYDEEERRGIVELYATAFALTLAAVVGAFAVIGFAAVLPAVLRVMGGDGAAQVAVDILRWPLVAALFAFALAVAYRYAACRDKPRWRWVSWGAAGATVLWILGSVVFSIYLSKFGDYEGTYGSLGAVVAFLMWLFLSSYLILLGAEFDAEMERQTMRDTTAGPEEPMGQRGAHAADTLGAAPGKKSRGHG
jgi:membrane protein